MIDYIRISILKTITLHIALLGCSAWSIASDLKDSSLLIASASINSSTGKLTDAAQIEPASGMQSRGITSTPESSNVRVSFPFTIKSVSAGKRLYAGLCASCHGGDGKGDTGFREFLKTPPADFTDSEWVYGVNDAIIFDVIKNGRVDNDMPAFGDKASNKRLWSLVHYVKYLNGQQPK